MVLARYMNTPTGYDICIDLDTVASYSPEEQKKFDAKVKELVDSGDYWVRHYLWSPEDGRTTCYLAKEDDYFERLAERDRQRLGK